MTRWRGLRDLVVDAVHHGASAVERVHRRTARAAVDAVALVPGLAVPARAVGAVQDAALAATYETIRQVNGVAGAAAGLALDMAERTKRTDPESSSAALPSAPDDPDKR